MTKFLLINEALLIGIPLEEQVVTENDLVFFDDKEDQTTYILPNGIQIINTINELITDFNYSLVFHSQKSLSMQLAIAQAIYVACSKKNIGFPQALILPVAEKFDNKQTHFMKPHRGSILIMDTTFATALYYGHHTLAGKEAVRVAIQNIWDTHEPHQLTIFDNDSLAIERAQQERYCAVQINERYTIAQGLQDELENCHKVDSADSPFRKRAHPCAPSPTLRKLTPQQRDRIVRMITKLSKEQNSFWSMNKELKQHKIQGLQRLINYTNEHSLADAILHVEQRYESLRSGFFSRRTANLLDDLKNYALDNSKTFS